MTDLHGLRRFEVAQDEAQTYQAAVTELRAGAKRSHWMWFIFPQIAGLGRSPISRTYAIATLGEAAVYMADPILGPRLVECARILLGLTGRTAEDIFGGVDAMKLRSSMTLFARAAPDNPVFQQVLDRYFDGRADKATLRLLDTPDAGGSE